MPSCMSNADDKDSNWNKWIVQMLPAFRSVSATLRPIETYQVLGNWLIFTYISSSCVWHLVGFIFEDLNVNRWFTERNLKMPTLEK